MYAFTYQSIHHASTYNTMLCIYITLCTSTMYVSNVTASCNVTVCSWVCKKNCCECNQRLSDCEPSENTWRLFHSMVMMAAVVAAGLVLILTTSTHRLAKRPRAIMERQALLGARRETKRHCTDSSAHQPFFFDSPLISLQHIPLISLIPNIRQQSRLITNQVPSSQVTRPVGENGQWFQQRG